MAFSSVCERQPSFRSVAWRNIDLAAMRYRKGKLMTRRKEICEQRIPLSPAIKADLQYCRWRYPRASRRQDQAIANFHLLTSLVEKISEVPAERQVIARQVAIFILAHWHGAVSGAQAARTTLEAVALARKNLGYVVAAGVLSVEPTEKSFLCILKAATAGLRFSRRDLIRIASDICGFDVGAMSARNRHHNATRPRMIAQWLCRKFTTSTTTEIGKTFDRDHTSILNSCDKVDRVIARYGLTANGPEEWARTLASMPVESWRGV